MANGMVNVPYGAKTTGERLSQAESNITTLNGDIGKLKKVSGSVTLYNKYVVEGLIVSKTAGSRKLTVSKTGTYTAGNTSHFYADGADRYFKDAQTNVTVPTNTGSSAATYYACLQRNATTKEYALVVVNAAAAASLLKLYSITVPAGDNKADLTNVTLTSVRRIEAKGEVQYSSTPTVSVSLGASLSAMGAVSFDVLASPISASPLQGVGDIIVTSKTSDGFVLSITGTADNVVIGYTVLYKYQ